MLHEKPPYKSEDHISLSEEFLSLLVSSKQTLIKMLHPRQQKAMEVARRNMKEEQQHKISRPEREIDEGFK